MSLLSALNEPATLQSIEQEAAQPKPKEKKISIDSEAEDPVEEILALIDKKGIQTPMITPPSPFMRWVRSWGIALLYKYYAVKAWVVGERCEDV